MKVNGYTYQDIYIYPTDFRRYPNCARMWYFTFPSIKISEFKSQMVLRKASKEHISIANPSVTHYTMQCILNVCFVLILNVLLRKQTSNIRRTNLAHIEYWISRILLLSDCLTISDRKPYFLPLRYKNVSVYKL